MSKTHRVSPYPSPDLSRLKSTIQKKGKDKKSPVTLSPQISVKMESIKLDKDVIDMDDTNHSNGHSTTSYTNFDVDINLNDIKKRIENRKKKMPPVEDI